MNQGGYRRILVFSFSFIGDTILSTCVIPPLQRHYPDAKVIYLTGAGAAPLLAGDPRIHEVLIYDNRGAHRGLRGKRRLIQQLRSQHFDLVVDLRDSIWSRFVGAERWGLANRTQEAHAVTRYLSAIEVHGVSTEDGFPRICLTASELDAAHKELGEPRGTFRIVMHPGGNWPYKRWPPQNFAALANRLIEELGVEVLLLAGPGEEWILDRVRQEMKFPPRVIHSLSLRHVAALLSLCDHYVGNDTGPMHLAAAMGTVVTALFASTDHRRSGPYGNRHRVLLGEKDLGCQPCHPGRRPGRCALGSCAVLNSIAVGTVFDTVCERLYPSFPAHVRPSS